MPPVRRAGGEREILKRSTPQEPNYLVRWIVRKYKRYRGKWMRARDALGRAAALYPRMFAHWQCAKP
jgi:RNA-directed DNA polymerase